MSSWTFGWMCAWLFSFSIHTFWLNDVVRHRAFTLGACRVICGDQAVESAGDKCYCIDAAGVKTPKETPKYPE